MTESVIRRDEAVLRINLCSKPLSKAKMESPLFRCKFKDDDIRDLNEEDILRFADPRLRCRFCFINNFGFK